jgi:AcrR family transcriptional regulator
MSTRRRSKSTQQNDERILDAALREIYDVGVDALAMTAVARRAGLTTGALYGRYENGNELAAAVWTARARDRHFALLDAAIAALVDGNDTVALDGLLRELTSPRKETIVALELLASARRIDELEEVVLTDVRQWIAGWGAGARTRQRRRRAQVVYTLGTIWGIFLHAAPGRLRLDWNPLLRRLAWSYAQPHAGPTERLVVAEVESVHAHTGDPVEDALVDAVAAIVARVGMERATGSRIARRAGLTSGAIYGRYETKEDLLQHAIEILLAQRFTDDLASIDEVLADDDPARASARTFAGYLSQPRRDWRLFRIESYLAARHQPRVAASLHRVQEAAKDDYLSAIGARSPEERRALEILARSAQVGPIGLAFADLLIPGVPSIDWRLVFEPLFSPSPTTTP